MPQMMPFMWNISIIFIIILLIMYMVSMNFFNKKKLVIQAPSFMQHPWKW